MMAWCAGNARVVPTPTAMRIARDEAGLGKIDPLMATFDAAELMSTSPGSTVIDVIGVPRHQGRQDQGPAQPGCGGRAPSPASERSDLRLGRLFLFKSRGGRYVTTSSRGLSAALLSFHYAISASSAFSVACGSPMCLEAQRSTR